MCDPLRAWHMPGTSAGSLGGNVLFDTPISWQFCAMHRNLCKFKVQCGMAARCGCRGTCESTMRDFNPRGETAETPQLFGLVASIAARLTIWPISLACSARARI